MRKLKRESQWLFQAVLWVLLGYVGTASASAEAEGEKEPEVEQSADRVPEWAAFEMDELVKERARSGRAYREFLRVPTLSAGVYHLAAGETDRQSPHDQDELYYIAAGRSRFVAAGEETEVGPGTVLFVKAGVEHRFVAIREDLTVLVFFAAPEP